MVAMPFGSWLEWVSTIGDRMMAKKTSVKIGSKAQEAEKSELELLREENARLKAQAESKSVGRVYAPAETPIEVAREVATHPEMMRDLGHLMVKRIPNSPKTKTHPYGAAVTVNSKAGYPINAMKDGLDRGDFIKLRNLAQTVTGQFWSYEDPTPLSEDQINKVLRPVLDNLKKAGLFDYEAE
jgi:hypothetical protein